MRGRHSLFFRLVPEIVCVTLPLFYWYTVNTASTQSISPSLPEYQHISITGASLLPIDATLGSVIR